MAKVTGRDCFFIVVLMVMLAVLTVGSSRGRGKTIPVDERHLPIYDALKSGRSQGETELICATCHGKSSLPMSKNHPPKEQCLICHMLAERKGTHRA